jgi:hypothetical protein
MMQTVRANDGRNGSDVWRRCRGGSHEVTERPRDSYYIMQLVVFFVFCLFLHAFVTTTTQTVSRVHPFLLLNDV